MRREEIIKLSGRELTTRLNESWKKGDITMKQYKAILEFWENNREAVEKRGGQQALIVE